MLEYMDIFRHLFMKGERDSLKPKRKIFDKDELRVRGLKNYWKTKDKRQKR